MKYFSIMKGKIAYMECVIQSSMFYSFYLFLSILLCNVDSTLFSDSNVYIWISNSIQIFEFIFECWRNVFLVHALGKWRLQMILARKCHNFTKSYNQFHDILRIFDVLPSFLLTTSETLGYYYLQTSYIRMPSRFDERLKTYRKYQQSV